MHRHSTIFSHFAALRSLTTYLTAAALFWAGCKTEPVGSVSSKTSTAKTVTCAALCQRILSCRQGQPADRKMAMEGCKQECRTAPPPPAPEGRFVAALKACVASTKNCPSLQGCVEKRLKALTAELAPRREDPNAIYKMPVQGAPSMGPPDALVTVVSFLDARCGYCRKAHVALKEIVKLYPKKVRLVQRHFPLGSPVSQKAAEAMFAVLKEKGDQAHWAYQEKLTGADKLETGDLAAMAKDVGADPSKVAKALSEGTHRARVQTDIKLGAQFGVQGTPCFFINGKKYPGYLDLAEFRNAIDGAMKKAQAAVAKGVPPAKVYAHLTASGHTKVRYLKKGAPEPGPRDLDPEAVFKVEVRPTHPQKGPGNALVTIVEFSDFQCPFCRRAALTMDELMKAHPGKLRLVFRHMPLPGNTQAVLAAEACMAALNQKGRSAFWAMHDKLFANAQDLGQPKLEAIAKELGLDVVKFRTALKERRYKSVVTKDLELARQLGINGAPQFFINGKPVAGALPLDEFRKVIDRALADAQKRVAGGVKPAKLYNHIIAKGHTRPVFKKR